jgi:acyl-CoA synthetase (AMP-forming)/AMP-acid ligase II/acyl carrier protein
MSNPNLPSVPSRRDPSTNSAKGFQRREAIFEFDNSKTAQSIPQRLGRLLEAHGKRTAIVAPKRSSLTYEELFKQTTDLVESLNQLGIGRGDRVALVLPDGFQLAISFLGISAAATCAPLTPSLRIAEFDSILSALAPKALAVASGTDSAVVAAAQMHSIPIIELCSVKKNGWSFLEVHGDRAMPVAQTGFAHAADVALVLFTSGTTARPKLVPLTHRNLLISAANIAGALELSPNDRCLNIMPLFHIHGLIGGLLASLASGGSVICPPMFSAEGFFPWIRDFQPTWYTAVPTMHQAILAQANAHTDVIRNSPLRFIRSSSSALPARLTTELEAVFYAPVIESYGMTEASHQIASNPLPPAKRKAGSVGRAAGPELAIMDELNQFQPIGTVGEVVIRGDNVMRGYEGSPAANEAAFTNDWFRTGDQGYLDDDGYLFLTGRLKELINRGGEKISPREIDEVLLTHPAVEQAAAFAVPHPTLGEEVMAAVVLRPGLRATSAEISDFVAGQISDFKIPKQILIVDEIPSSATGKLRRVDLVNSFADRLRGAAQSPETELESVVAAIYQAVLGVEAVGAGDNFFALGGDSLRATQIISRIRAALDVDLSIATIFRNPTVSLLSAEIVRALEDADGDSSGNATREES